MSQTIGICVENYGSGGEGPFRAGMAVVRLNGDVVANLRTSEAIEFTIHSPAITIARGK
jgi:hypothetical protein